MSEASKKIKGKHARHAAPSIPPISDDISAQDTVATPPVQAQPMSHEVSQFEDLPPLSNPPTAALPNQTFVMPAQQGHSAVSHAVGSTHPGAVAYVPGAPMLPVDMKNGKTKTSHKPLKIIGIILGILLAILAILYIAGAFVFMDRFLPNTNVGTYDISLKSSAEVQGILTEALDDYAIEVDGQAFTMTLSAKDAGMKLDASKATDSMHDATNPWLWPIEIRNSHDYSDKFAASYNESGLGDKTLAAVDAFNATATPPTNATVAYDSVAKSFIVQPEEVGTALSFDAVIKAIDQAVIAMEPTLKLTKEQLMQPTVLSTDPKLAAAASQANTMIQANMVLTMAGATAGEVNADLISQWIRFGDDLVATLDEAALVAWVNDLEARCDTVGTTRTYTRPNDGKIITVGGGVYGWSVDHDGLMNMVKEGVASATVGTLEVPCISTGTAYNGAGAQDWGLRYCDIDLSEQYVRFFDETGALVWESACVTGTPNGSHDTPSGVFWLNQKASPSKLKGTNLDGSKYDTTVQYWMPFDQNIVGMHDADWQAAFGGTLYREGRGSHGCVNLPPGKAAELYGIIRSGDVVISHW